VGAGGIGCELLKNLAQSGFRNVEVIDLDTIDVSNLNRQFLFRAHHVGMPKCTVACEVATAMCPALTCNGDEIYAANFIAHHGNVKDNERFDVSFFKRFDVVLNALDNVDARRHVNRLCLASTVPLVEAGTTGYLGQVTVIAKDANVECYECQPKPTQKVYPICTIRSTPSMPVHTIVWAKELFKLMFHEKPELSMLYEDPILGKQADLLIGSQEAKSDDNSPQRPSVYMDIVIDRKPKHDPSADETVIRQYACDCISALYAKEIQKQLEMDRYKTAKKKPFALSNEILFEGCFKLIAPTKQEGYRSTDSWTPVECVSELAQCVVDAYTSNIIPFPTGEFDKDDSLSMRFVTAASNLRSHQFGIPMQSFHDAKGIAGNIIPAIATTNAIVAGLQVLQVFKLLRLKMQHEESAQSDRRFTDSIRDECHYTYCLRDKTRKGFYLQPTKLPEPNPKCFVCRNSQVEICLDTESWNLFNFVQKVIKGRLGFAEPSILVGDSQIYEEGDGADTDCYSINLIKPLTKLPGGGIKNGTIVRVEDFSQDLEVDLCIVHNAQLDEKDVPDLFLIGGDVPKATTSSSGELSVQGESKPESDPSGEPSVQGESKPESDPSRSDTEHDVVVVLENDDEVVAVDLELNTSRKRTADDAKALDDIPLKKTRHDLVEIA